MSEIDLLKALVEAGIGSRRKVVEAIKTGKVKLNGRVPENYRQPVNPEKDKVTFEGRPVKIAPRKLVYVMLNKPFGAISTTNDEEGRQSVIDVLPPQYRQLGLYPVGRLDSDSTGLLVLTNDGSLTYELTHPRFEHDKEYAVKLDTTLKPLEQRRLENGIMLEDGPSRPAVIKKSLEPGYDYTITIHEGRKRQVRRMFEHVGHQVQSLKRIRIGDLRLGDLPEGKSRELRPEEVKALLASDK